MGHAVAGEVLFRDDADRWEFVRRTARVLQEEDGIAEAHSEMPNHFHLGLLTRSSSVSTIMQRIETGYAHYYNLRHDRKGHLFRNRFLSKLISTPDYRITALLYIHCNPLKAGIVRSLDELAEFPFTGHAALMGNGLPWIQDLSALGLFGDRIGEARRRLKQQMAAALERMPDDEEHWFCDAEPEERSEIEERAAADSRRSLVRATDECLRARRRSGQMRLQWPLEDIIRQVAHRVGALKRDVIAGSRTKQTAEARAVICHLATRVLGYSPSIVAAALAVSTAAVCQAARRGRDVVESDRSAFLEFLIPAQRRRRG